MVTSYYIPFTWLSSCYAFTPSVKRCTLNLPSHSQLQKTLVMFYPLIYRILFSSWELPIFPQETKGCCNKVPQAERLKQQKCVASQFWKLEVQAPGGAGWAPGLEEGSDQAPPWLVDDRLPPRLSISLRVSVPIPSCGAGTRNTGLEPPWGPHFNLVISVQRLFPATLWGPGAFSICVLGKGTQ